MLHDFAVTSWPPEQRRPDPRPAPSRPPCYYGAAAGLAFDGWLCAAGRTARSHLQYITRALWRLKNGLGASGGGAAEGQETGVEMGVGVRGGGEGVIWTALVSGDDKKAKINDRKEGLHDDASAVGSAATSWYRVR